MASPLQDQLSEVGTAQVIVVLKRDGTGASASIVDPGELRSCFVGTESSLAGALALSVKADKRPAAASARSEGARPTAKAPPKMRVYENLGVVYGSVDANGYAALRADKARVRAVVLAPQLSLIRPVGAAAAADPDDTTWGIRHLNIPALWDRGFTGADIVVGHLDTGIDGRHPALAPAIQAFAEFDDFGVLVPHDPGDAFDTGDHGTHTAGTIAGRALGGTRIGVAPDAMLASAVVIEGGDVVARVLGGMDWSIEQGAQVLNMSLGLRGYWANFLPVTQILRQRGVLPVFAAGNEGAGTSRSPGNYAECVSVGAVDAANKVAGFSSSQKFARPADPYVPDLVAPGVGVVSSLPGGGFGSMDGSSMATPHVAGLAALLMQARPDRSLDDIEAAILKSCKRPAGMARLRANRGVPDAVRALANL